MKYSRKYILPFALAFTLLSAQGNASVGLSVGYNNPHASGLGINLTGFLSEFAIEGGIGGLYLDNKAFSLRGDLDLKYLFSSGAVRPYLDAGVMWGLGAGSDASGLGVGGLFAGGGIHLSSQTLFGYLGADFGFWSKMLLPVLGIGFYF